MHALAIAQEIVRQSVNAAEREGPVQIRAFHIKLGPLDFVSRDELEFCIQAAAQGTIAEGAAVHIREVEKGKIEVEGVDVEVVA